MRKMELDLQRSMKTAKSEPAVTQGMEMNYADSRDARRDHLADICREVLPSNNASEPRPHNNITDVLPSNSMSDPRHTRRTQPSHMDLASVVFEGGSFREEYKLCGDVLDSTPQRQIETAVHKQTGRKVIVKTFNLSQLSRSNCHDLQAEIATQSAINHKNVAQLQAVYNSGRHVRLVMEYLEGGDVLEILNFRGTFSEAETASVIKQLLEAVENLHDNGVVHRDIKLENMVFEGPNTDQVKLIDFGYSTFWEDGMPPMRRSCGTITYMPPEVLRGAYTSKADLWCVGAAAHAMLTGSSLGRRHSGAPVFAAAFSRCSPAAQDFVNKLLRMEPRRRMSAKEALRHHWLQDMTQEAPELGKSSRVRSLSDVTGRRSLSAVANFGRRRISAMWTAVRQAKQVFRIAPETQIVPSHIA